MINKNDQKRIVTNEDLFDHISGFKLEVRKTIGDFKSEMKVSTKDLSNAILRLEGSLEDLRKSTSKGFDMVFKTIDDRLSSIEDNMTYKHQLSPKFA